MAQFVKVDGARVRYVVEGSGFPVVLVPAGSSHLDLSREHGPYRAWLDDVAGFARVVQFDHRGMGVSDPYDSDVERFADALVEDVLAVLDAEGIAQTDLLAFDVGGLTAIRVAAEQPHRVRRVIMINTCARFVAADDHDAGVPIDAFEFSLRFIEDEWGTGATFAVLEPAVARDERLLAWWARYERSAITPAVHIETCRRFGAIDVRSLVPLVQQPCLVIHATGDPYVRVAQGRWLADNLPDARLVEYDSDGHMFFYEHRDLVTREVRRFLTGDRGHEPGDRVLEAILFTDIVGSTERAAAEGDAAWAMRLREHDARAADVVETYGGTIVKSTGDGLLATFASPSSAVRCARQLNRRLAALGVAVRAGIHVGEIEHHGDDVAGIGVHIAARVQAYAAPRQILVTRTVRDVVTGSDLRFASCGIHDLRGVPDAWELFSVV